MRHLILLVFLLLIPASAQAENRAVTVRGVIGTGTLDSAIGGLGPIYSFFNDSDVARTIFSTCQDLDNCEITGTADEHDFLQSVSSVRRIDIDVEPSVDIITDAACWASSLKDELNNNLRYVSSINISNFHSTSNNNQTVWQFDFELVTILNNAFRTKKVSLGTASVSKHGKTWHYFK